MTTPVAGVTHDVVLGEYGFMLQPGTLRRRDITSAIPKISMTSEAKSHSDLSELDVHGQETFHHGRGELYFDDPSAFFDAELVDTRIKNQAILASLRNQVAWSGIEQSRWEGGTLDDMSTSGTSTLATGACHYNVVIDATGPPNTFKWSDDGGVSWDAEGVAITGSAQALNNGVTITFAATTGHAVNDKWTFEVRTTADFGGHAVKFVDYGNTPYMLVRGYKITNGTLDSATATTFTHDALSEANDYWNGGFIWITGGTGVGQVREITDFDAATDTGTVVTWDTTPDNTSTYEIHLPRNADNGLFSWNNTTGKMVHVNTRETGGDSVDASNADPTNMIVFPDSADASSLDLWLACGETMNMLTYDASAGAWESGGVPATYLTQHDGYLWRADNINEVYYSDDPDGATPTWSGPIEVGISTSSITGLGVYQNQVVAFTEDKFYFIEKQGDEYKAYCPLDFTSVKESDNMKGHATFQGYLFFNTLFGLWKYDGSTVLGMGPDRGAHPESTEHLFISSFQSPRHGLPWLRERYPGAYQSTWSALDNYGKLVSLEPTNNWLFAAVDAGPADAGAAPRTSSIMAYGGLGWHQITEAAVQARRIRAVKFTPALSLYGVLSKPALWFGEGNAVYYLVIPEGTENPDDYTGYTYETTGTLDTQWFSANLIDVFKTAFFMKVFSANLLTDNEEILVQYQRDFDTTWQTLGTAKFSPSQRLDFPEGTTFYWIRFRFTLSRGSTSTETPVFKGYWIYYLARPDAKYGWNMTLILSDERPLIGDQGRDAYTAGELSNILWLMRDSKVPLYFDDGRGMDRGINLCLNPSFELDSNADGLADGWSKATGTTATLSSQYRTQGTYSQRLTNTLAGYKRIYTTSAITVVPGTKYTLTADIYAASLTGTGAYVSIELLNTSLETIHTFGYLITAASGGVGSGYSTPLFTRLIKTTGGSWQLSLPYTIPDGVTSVHLSIGAQIPSGGSSDFYVDAVKFTAEDELTPYFDGDASRCYWSTAPHNSTSVRAQQFSVFITAISERITRMSGGNTESLVPLSLTEVGG
uniref:Putative structural protein n=1 Tax=viral metagenome TaxID=1070528 RepID=A0A6M3J6D5_9ZZZZ